MIRWRLLDTGYADGATNMAVDEAMVEAFAHGGGQPTLELGCPLKAPFRSLAFTTACGNLGELKIFEKGLVHVDRSEIVPLIVG